MPAVRAGRRKDSFKFQAGDDIAGPAIAINIMGFWVIGVAASGHDDGPHMKRDVFGLIFIIDGPGRTKFFTRPAFSFGQKKALRVINGVFQGNRLGVLHINGLAVG